jgi:hypothetical protein
MSDEQTRLQQAEQDATATLLSLEEVRKLGEAMAKQHTIFVSDREMAETLARDQQNAVQTSAPPIIDRRDGTTRSEAPVDVSTERDPTRLATNKPADEPALRDITVPAIPAAEMEAPRREAVTPVQTGIGIREGAFSDPDHESYTQLKARAYAAMIGVADKGDAIAAGRLQDILERNGSRADIEREMAYLKDAKDHEDKRYRTRDGKIVEITHDGNPDTNDVSVDGAEGSDSVGGGVFGGSRRRGGGMMGAVTLLGALAVLSKTNSPLLQELSMTSLTGGTDVPSFNPFSLSSPQTPPQERQPLLDLGLYL